MLLLRIPRALGVNGGAKPPIAKRFIVEIAFRKLRKFNTQRLPFRRSGSGTQTTVSSGATTVRRRRQRPDRQQARQKARIRRTSAKGGSLTLCHLRGRTIRGLGCPSRVVDGEVATWIQNGLVPVVKAHEVRRGTVGTADFEYLAVTVGRPDSSAMNDDPISLGCFHRNHLPGSDYECWAAVGTACRWHVQLAELRNVAAWSFNSYSMWSAEHRTR